MNIYLIDAILIYFMLVYLAIGIPWVFYFLGDDDWKDKWIATTGCAIAPFIGPPVLGLYLLWRLLKALFGILLVIVITLAYIVYFLEEHMPVGTLFQAWFAAVYEFFQLLIRIFNFLLGLQLNPLKKTSRPTDESASA
jgi:hypothetical protein